VSTTELVGGVITLAESESLFGESTARVPNGDRLIDTASLCFQIVWIGVNNRRVDGILFGAAAFSGSDYLPIAAIVSGVIENCSSTAVIARGGIVDLFVTAAID